MDRVLLNKAALLLTGILVAAFVLRFWGVWFGLPYLFHNDEGFEVIRALQLGTGDFNFERIGKGGYFYLLFVEYAALFVVLLVSGVVGSTADFAALYVSDPSWFYLVGRTTTAVLGTLTVYFVYRLADKAFGQSAGVLAAGFLAANILHSYLSHLITVDVPMALLATITLFFAVRMVTEFKRRDYLWAAFFAALAATTKIPAVLLLLPLLIAHVYVVRQTNGQARDYLASVSLLQAAAVFAITYVITTPGIMLYFDDVVLSLADNFIGGEAARVSDGDFEPDPRAMIATTSLYMFYLQVIADGMTYPVFLVCIAGLVYSLFRRSATDVMLTSFVIVYYFAIASSSDPHLFFPRYVTPLLPLLCILGGRLIGDLLERSALAGRASAVAVVLVVLCALPLTRIVAEDLRMTRTDTRVLAKDWFDSNVPSGAKVLIEGARTNASNMTAPLQNSEENIMESIRYFRERGELGKVKFFRHEIESLGDKKTYDLVTVNKNTVPFEVEAFKEQGVRYFVLRPDAYINHRTLYEWPEFVSDLRSDPDIELAARFDPEAEDRTGPLIEVYRVRDQSEESSSDNQPGNGDESSAGFHSPQHVSSAGADDM